MGAIGEEKKLNRESSFAEVDKLGPYKTKIHKEELIELLDLWEYGPGIKEKLEHLIENDEKLKGPHLFRYYNPRPSKVDAAEEEFKKMIGSKHCLAVNSCTSALICALRALGVGAGDEVIVPGYTFFASAAVVGTCNAIPIIADIDETLSIDPKDLERRISPRTKAIIIVHMRGTPARMDEIMAVANKHNIPVIEDVAQAAGGSYKGKMLGSIGTIGCFSFDYYKVLNSGEGGFVVTNDEWLFTRAQSWHDCAACWRPNRFSAEKREGELFCGENYRMSELQGAVALAQIKKSENMIAGYRRSKASIIEKLNLPEGAKVQPVADVEGDIGSVLTIYLPSDEVTKRALPLLQEAGIPAGGIYDKKVRDWHIYPYWDHILGMKSVAKDGLPWTGVDKADLPKYSANMCPQVLDILARSIMVEINSEFSEQDCEFIAGSLNRIIGEAVSK